MADFKLSVTLLRRINTISTKILYSIQINKLENNRQNQSLIFFLLIICITQLIKQNTHNHHHTQLLKQTS